MKRGRKAKLNFTPSLNQFTCTIEGTLHRLGNDEKQARQEFAFLTAKDNPTPSNPTFASIADKWLDDVAKNNTAKRYTNAKRCLEGFLGVVGESIRVRDLTPEMLDKWLVEKEIYKAGTVRLYKAVILRALNWAASHKVRLIPANPLKGLVELPEGESRGGEVLWTPEIFQLVTTNANRHFRDFLNACAWTGARPGVIRKVEARHYIPHLKLWDVEDLSPKNSRKKTRRVWLDKRMVKMVERLNAQNPEGPIFRNHFSDPYTSDAVTLCFAGMRERLGLPDGLVVYGLRHTFATNFIVAHPDKLEYLRNLLGWKNLDMIYKHYGHLFDQHAHLHSVLDFAGL